uniref:Uncharacterized protein n=1 Tax=Acrobeloides nanus TaxID=290746 RepID=A0A914C1Y0_9BILA
MDIGLRVLRTMHLLNILANCTRRVNLWKFLRKTREFEAFLKVNDDLFEELTEETGMEITYRNLFMVEDLMHIEQKRGYKLDSYEIELDDRIIYANHQMLKFLNGLSVSPYRGIKFDIEIPKVEAGELLNEILTHMQEKEDCLFDETLNENCTEILRRKYYAYSAHDITMAAFFATLGLKHTDYDKNGNVPLASCIMIEQWLRPDSTSYVKIYYMRRNQPSIDITPKISGCEANCSLIDFSQRSEVYLPDPDINTLCDTPIFNAS